MFVRGDVKKESHGKGKTLFHEGDSGDAMYIVESGAVTIVKSIEGAEVCLATLRQGELFGEMAIIDGSPRMASAVVEEDCVLIRIPHDLLESKMRKFDPFLKAMVNILITNLRNVHRAFMKRPRSVHDYVNAIDYHSDGFKRYLECLGDSESVRMADKHVVELDRIIANLRDDFKDYQDRRRNVMTDVDLASINVISNLERDSR